MLVYVSGHAQVPFAKRVKVVAHALQVSATSQAVQFARLQLMQLSPLGRNPALQTQVPFTISKLASGQLQTLLLSERTNEVSLHFEQVVRESQVPQYVMLQSGVHPAPRAVTE